MQYRFQKLVQQRKNQQANSRMRMMRRNYHNFTQSSNNHVDQEVSNSLISKDNTKKL